MDGGLLSDTTVLAHLTKTSRHSHAHLEIIAGRRIALSFQTIAELLSANYGTARGRRLEVVLSTSLLLPHSEDTNIWYAGLVRTRKSLKSSGRSGGDAGDADVWIISSAMEYGLPLMSHDAQQVMLARAAGHPAFTSIAKLRADNPAP